MTFFFERFIKPFLVSNYSTRLLEIGASEGNHSDRLLELDGTTLTIVDPCLDKPLDAIYASNDRAHVVKDISLRALDSIDGTFDAILIDGDHNWYTVYHELLAIEERNLLAPNGVVFFHDVAWPYARRDMYYQPELIPPEHRQPHSQKGIVQTESRLSETGGLNAFHYNADSEGGAKNGVLTAIEDFIKQSSVSYELFIVYEENGLGVLVRPSDALAKAAFDQLVAYRKSELRKAALRTRFPWLYRVAKRLTGR